MIRKEPQAIKSQGTKERKPTPETSERVFVDTLHSFLLERAEEGNYDPLACEKIRLELFNTANIGQFVDHMRHAGVNIEYQARKNGYHFQILTSKPPGSKLQRRFPSVRYIPVNHSQLNALPEGFNHVERFNLPENVEKDLLEKNIHIFLLEQAQSKTPGPLSFADLLEAILNRSYTAADLRYLKMITTYLEVYGRNHGLELEISSSGLEEVAAPLLEYTSVVRRVLPSVIPQIVELLPLSQTEEATAAVVATGVPIAVETDQKDEPVEEESSRKENSELVKVMKEAATQVAEIFFAARLKVDSLRIESVNQALKESKSKERVSKDLFLKHGIGVVESMTFFLSPREFAIVFWVAKKGFKLDQDFCEEYQAFVKTLPAEEDVKDLELKPTHIIDKQGKKSRG